MAHYHSERNHQGLENQLLRPAPIVAPSQPVHRRQRLGGLLNYYHRVASLVAACRNRRLYESAREHVVKDTWALITL
jgi:hypothetical protein